MVMRSLAQPQHCTHAGPTGSLRTRRDAFLNPRSACTCRASANGPGTSQQAPAAPATTATTATTRRSITLGSLTILALEAVHNSMPSQQARALTLAEVTPEVVPAGPLPAREQAIVDLFEANTYSVVNVVDVTLQIRGGAPLVDTPEGNGSGFVWDSSGHIITNYHVLGSVLKGLGPAAVLGQGSGRAPPRVARVTLLGTDGFQQSYDAVLVGADRNRDLVVLKIDAAPELLRPVKLGDSNSLKVGQQCLAIGNPFGFLSSLSTGVISGLDREIRSQLGVLIPGGIQTDAAINPGNSGGPLLDSAGRVIGVNTAIFTNTGTSAGVGFSIPINAVKRVVDQLITYGKVVRPSLNVQVANDSVARKLRVSRGALLQSVLPGGAAAAAGLLPTRRGLGGIVPGDVVVGLNGRAVNNAGDLESVLDGCGAGVGETVRLDIVRTGDQGQQTLGVDVVLQEER